MSSNDEAQYIRELAASGIPRSHTCEDGTVIDFRGDGTSQVNQEATKRNKKAIELQQQKDRWISGKVKSIEARLDAIEANHG